MSAAGQRISVVISAVDDFSKQFEAFNKRIANITAPMQRLQKSLGRLSDATGVTKLSKGFGDLARGALDTFRNAARAVEPLAAITGAASIAGMIRLTQAWASWGAQLGFAARRLGIMPDALQSLQGAARLAGASASSLNSGLQTLGGASL